MIASHRPVEVVGAAVPSIQTELAAEASPLELDARIGRDARATLPVDGTGIIGVVTPDRASRCQEAACGRSLRQASERIQTC